jgi:hypothetical protein
VKDQAQVARRFVYAGLLVLLSCGVAKADFVDCVVDTCDFQNIQVDVILGTAQLFAPGGAYLSTTTMLTTDFPLWPDIESQVAADPTPFNDGVPTYVHDHLADLIGNTDLGAFASPQGVVSISDSEQNLLNQLENIGQPFSLTGDSGLYNLGQALGYSYDSVVQSAPGQFDVGFVQVNFYEHDIQETLSAVPEPTSLPYFAAGMICALVLMRRKKRPQQ